MIVRRFSTNILADIARGYSCWMGSYASIDEAVETCGNNHASDLLTRSQRDEWDITSESECSEVLAAARAEGVSEEEIAEAFGLILGSDGLYRFFHHDGLSVMWDEMEEEDYTDTLETYPNSFELGWMTIGKVALLRSEGDWHLLSCDDVAREPEY